MNVLSIGIIFCMPSRSGHALLLDHFFIFFVWRLFAVVCKNFLYFTNFMMKVIDLGPFSCQNSHRWCSVYMLTLFSVSSNLLWHWEYKSLLQYFFFLVCSLPDYESPLISLTFFEMNIYEQIDVLLWKQNSQSWFPN